MPFKIAALPKSEFQHLFELSTSELTSFDALRTVATKKPGFPCRVSLADAEIGEDVLLIHYEHQSAATPFRASHAVYVRPQANQANPKVNEVPEMLRSRVLSLRGFDNRGMMTAADLTDGKALDSALDTLFSDPQTAYIHIHFAKPGCYAARVDRATL